MKITNLILFICIITCFSCDRSEDLIPIVSTTQSSSIEISVFECLSDGCFEKQIIPGAKLVIYSNQEDQEDHRNAIFSSTTGIDGKVFVQINVNCVYITVQYNQQIQALKENTPAGTHSFVEVLF